MTLGILCCIVHDLNINTAGQKNNDDGTLDTITHVYCMLFAKRANTVEPWFNDMPREC